MRRLAELHKETSEERQRKATELEGIVHEFRAHVQVHHTPAAAIPPGSCLLSPSLASSSS